MCIKVGINGFGRTGRIAMRVLYKWVTNTRGF